MRFFTEIGSNPLCFSHFPCFVSYKSPFWKSFPRYLFSLKKFPDYPVFRISNSHYLILFCQICDFFFPFLKKFPFKWKRFPYQRKNFPLCLNNSPLFLKLFPFFLKKFHIKKPKPLIVTGISAPCYTYYTLYTFFYPIPPVSYSSKKFLIISFTRSLKVLIPQFGLFSLIALSNSCNSL